MNTINTVEVELSVVLGAARIPIHQLLRMGRGAVIELDAREDEDVHILANNLPIARGRVLLRACLENRSWETLQPAWIPAFAGMTATN